MNLSQSGWIINEGQAVWRHSREAPEIAGEVLVARHPDGRSYVQFTKDPFPLLSAQRTLKSWELRIPAENKRYSGLGKPPAKLIWLYLPDLLAGGAPMPKWEWQLEGSDWTLSNAKSGERIQGFFAK